MWIIETGEGNRSGFFSRIESSVFMVNRRFGTVWGLVTALIVIAGVMVPAGHAQEQGEIPEIPNAELMYEQGIAAFERGKYQTAYERFRLVTEYELNQKTTDAALMAGKSLVRLERYQEAIDWLQQLIDRFPESSQTEEAKTLLARSQEQLQGNRQAQNKDEQQAGKGSDKNRKKQQKNHAESRPVVDVQIPETGMNRPDDIAVVVGIKNYENEDIPNVEYALRDARIIKKYLIHTLGFRAENVIFEKNVTGSALQRLFGTEDNPQGKIYNYVRPGKSEVFVYYSGHGAPSPESNRAYLVPSDANPNYLSLNGYPTQQLYENLAQVPAKSVTVVLEACFSGTSEGGAVVQNASPVELSVENPVMAMENGLAFTAGAADQISSWYPEKKHGLFTYFFLKGLRGAADRNDDRAVTGAEMGQYLKNKVPYRARRMHNREQTPQVVGQNKDRVLVRYGADASAQGKN